MSVRLKVCGLKDVANVQRIADMQPDYLGFIFYDKSPRYVGEDFAIKLSNYAGETVGVFVNDTRDRILQQLATIDSHTAQLHGHESPDLGLELRDAGVRVIKAIPIGDKLELSEIRKFRHAVDYFLFDTKGKLFGGNAVRFDWTLLHAYDLDVPFFVSGGITVESLDELGQIANPRLHAVDMNSGIELSPGVKNPELTKMAKEKINKL